MVFSVDRFEVLAHKDAVFDSAVDEQTFVKPWGEPLLVIASIPTDLKEQQRLIDETLFEGKPDIHQRPEFWSHYEHNVDDVFARARPLSELQEFGPEITAQIAELENRYTNSEDLVYVPVMGKKSVFSLVLNKSTRQPVEIIDADPWEAPQAVAQL